MTGTALVTGATGFIGRALCAKMLRQGWKVRGAFRQVKQDDPALDAMEWFRTGPIGPDTDWSQALEGVDVVVHLAARVHTPDEPTAGSLEVFRTVNVLGTGRLARMARRAGVKRFIFLSSIKVNGEGRELPYRESDPPDPRGAYGISKFEAERTLADIAGDTGLQTVVLRCPLVYGEGVKANFRSLIRLAGSGLPLPFNGVRNQRSFLYLGNLTDAIILCAVHPAAAGEIFMVCDGQDLSTPELIRMIARAMNRKPILFSLPCGVLSALSRFVGKQGDMDKFSRTLIVDSSRIRSKLGWKPPFTVEEGIRETIRHYTA